MHQQRLAGDSPQAFERRALQYGCSGMSSRVCMRHHSFKGQRAVHLAGADDRAIGATDRDFEHFGPILAGHLPW